MGAMGLPVLLAVLHEDRDDLELTRTALEALALSFAAGGAGGTPGHAAAAARGEVRRNASLQLQRAQTFRRVLTALQRVCQRRTCANG